MKNRILYIAAAIVFVMIANISAMDFRVNQIPNGGKFGCANCHISPAGGGARNAFGQMVESKYLDFNGNVKWSAAMAAEDPDGDGFTNGQELQDPTGAWGAGDKAPGTAGLVTNPGDRNSKPAGTDVEGLELPTTYSLAQNYPNPFNPTTTINFSLPVSGKVVLEVFDISGKSVVTLLDNEMQSGVHSVELNAADLSSGVYFYRLRANQFIATRKFVLMK
ncbi:MAG: T9SS type A sorting domain-containing protein [Ignavibacteria bacterium]|nr:T9SS type A sorting domain-containing protein [Ignavibacteria bacterium]